VEDPASEADGLRAAEAGLQGRDAPRHLDAEGTTPPRQTRGDRQRDANSIPTGPLSAGRNASYDRHGHADETPRAARLERSGSRARSGRDGL